MRKKFRQKQPGLGDFKNKCSTHLRLYDSYIVRIIYEAVQDNLYSRDIQRLNGRNITIEVKDALKIHNLSVIHLEQLVFEMVDYFGNFIFSLDGELALNK